MTNCFPILNFSEAYVYLQTLLARSGLLEATVVGHMDHIVVEDWLNARPEAPKPSLDIPFQGHHTDSHSLG